MCVGGGGGGELRVCICVCILFHAWLVVVFASPLPSAESPV